MFVKCVTFPSPSALPDHAENKAQCADAKEGTNAHGDLS